MRTIQRLLLTFAAAMTVTMALSASPAEGLRGAAAILDQISAGADTPPPDKAVFEAAKLRAALSNFTARASILSPPEAAREWLNLADRKARLSGRAWTSMPMQMIGALPPPSAWNELAKAIEARPPPDGLKDCGEIGLRMLGSALAGDRASLAAQGAALDELIAKAQREPAVLLIHFSREFNEALLTFSEDSKSLLAAVDRQLASADGGGEYGPIELPDLVGIVGEAVAAPWLERAVKSKARSLNIEGKATRALARRLALQGVNELKTPRWELVDSVDAVELFEAMERKFSPDKPAVSANPSVALRALEREVFDYTSSRQTAQTYYLMGLIVGGRTEDATKFAETLRNLNGGYEFQIAAGEAALGKAGFLRELDDFLHALLSKNPGLPFWESYVAVAAKAGTTSRMLSLARAAAEKRELGDGKTVNIRELLYRALLAADQVEEGVKELRTLIASRSREGQQSSRSSKTSRDPQHHALTLAGLGLVLERPEWVAEGLDTLMRRPDGGDNDEDRLDDYRLKQLAAMLVKSGRLAEAEKRIADFLARRAREASDPSRHGFGGRRRTAEPLLLLTEVYHRAGRHADVLLLLEKSPHWGVRDFSDLFDATRSGLGLGMAELETESHGKTGRHHPLAESAVAALSEAGRKTEARAIVDAMLEQQSGNDRAYELLIQLAGQGALPKLDELFARDPFEERPLIWKASLLRQAGKLEEAETTARRAISIDPSDGEQGKNDRMRIYSVLADIRAARGDEKEAEIMRGAVRAIRLSERADDFHAAGLLSRAVKMYQESLGHFADAYCIQSRLAVHLTELGQHELAAKHYEKAFELMPDSFGRIESHCFGCEGTFSQPRAQGVADRVFATLVTKSPGKPQIHYLLGYLRQQQGRGKEAIPHFRQALKLDPDYLNAWVRLDEIGREHRLPVTERDAIAFNILRLDPRQKHASVNLETVGDLGGLWRAVEAAAKFQVKPPGVLLPLPASRAALDKQEREANSKPYRPLDDYTTYGRGTAATPASTLARHKLLTAIGRLAATDEQIRIE